MKATRRTTVSASGVAVLGLAGCTGDDSQPRSGDASSSVAATETASPDPDRVALDRAVTITTTLLAELSNAPDPGGQLAALHTAHLTALDRAAGPSAAATPSPLPPAGRITRQRLRRLEGAAQRELAHLAQEAASGALARLLASMSAGIAAHLALGDRLAP